MERNEFTSDNRFRWISKIFFSVSDSPDADVNPFEDVPTFVEAKVGDLTWGKDAQARQQAKDKFVKSVGIIFNLYDFVIPAEEISKGLQNEGQKMRELITHLCAVGQFPKD